MVNAIAKAPQLRKTASKLSFFQKYFDELRELLTPKRNSPSADVKEQIPLYLNRLSPLFSYFPELEKIKIRLERYWDHLFHAYDIPTLPRVNNGVENFNRLLKRIYRKMTGRRDNWLFIEHYGPSLVILLNFVPKGKDDPRSPLEKLGVISAADIHRFLMDITRADLNQINKSIELRTKQHKINIQVINKGVDWFLKEFVKIWLEINENYKECDSC